MERADDARASSPATQRTQTQRRLGEVLIADGLISPEQLQWALDVGERTGSRLGAILVAAGLVPRLTLYQLLAREWRLEFIDVTAADIDPAVSSGLDPARLLREGWLPIGERPDGTLLIASSERPDVAFYTMLVGTFHRRVRVMVTTDWDILQGLHRVFGERVVDEACSGLWQRNAAQSARQVFTTGQRVALSIGLTGLVALFVVAPRTTFVGLLAAAAAAVAAASAFKLLASIRGGRSRGGGLITADDIVALGDRDLPTYTVLVPLYRDAEIVGDVIARLGRLNYPADRLEILLLMEHDDAATIAAARAAAPPPAFTFVIVPERAPRTKPKACNVGLFLARGEHVVVFDAEDDPEPDQLRKAVVAFRRGGPNLACVQASSRYGNADENTLTRLGALERTSWYDFILPGLSSMGLPVPLGGTSNHFRTDSLRQLGGWDPFNATEDADLGIRSSASGYAVETISSTTFEEADDEVGGWMRQRSRWSQGSLQTLIVHLRHPWRLVRSVGLRQAIAFTLLIGGTPLSFLLAPLLAALVAVRLLAPSSSVAALVPTWLVWAAVVSLLLANATAAYVATTTAIQQRRYRLILRSLLGPLAWCLHSVAAYRAVWQLGRRHP
jgi:cellulose synthase/poly-beta-1,6-N-acetylglucosamine synthase-like glycosyltransferase